MAERVLNIAYLGNGKGANRYHIPFVLAMPDRFRVRTIQARHIDHDAWAAVPGVRYTTDLGAVLDDPEVDVVEVVTPPATHAELARQVLDAGKHCVVDKPFCATVGEAEALFDLARKRGVTIQCYQNRRFDSDLQTAKALIEEGRLGRVFEAVVTFDLYRPAEPAGKGYHPLDGAVYGLACHEVDQLIYLFGVPERVECDVRQLLGPGEPDDCYAIDLFYDGGHLKATAKGCNYMARPRPSVEVWGSLGSFVKWDKDSQERDLKHFYLPAGHDDFGLDAPGQWGTLVAYDGEGRRHEERVETVRSTYCRFYEALWETVTQGAPPLVRPEETLAQLEILERATRDLR